MRTRIAVLMLVALLARLGGTAVAATPPTLSGERLFQSSGGLFQLACNPDQTGTFTYTNSGIASGPYPGPYTETGTVTIGTSRVVTALTATFEITSGTTHITGTKVFDHPADLGFSGFCVGTLEAHASAYARYTATIQTSSGSFHDEGTSLVVAEAGTSFGTYLNEDFSSSFSEVVPVGPTSKDQCKHGGWQNFPQFKNQGDCVSYVATGGKNPPSGS